MLATNQLASGWLGCIQQHDNAGGSWRRLRAPTSVPSGQTAPLVRMAGFGGTTDDPHFAFGIIMVFELTQNYGIVPCSCYARSSRYGPRARSAHFDLHRGARPRACAGKAPCRSDPPSSQSRTSSRRHLVSGRSSPTRSWTLPEPVLQLYIGDDEVLGMSSCTRSSDYPARSAVRHAADLLTEIPVVTPRLAGRGEREALVQGSGTPWPSTMTRRKFLVPAGRPRRLRSRGAAWN